MPYIQLYLPERRSPTRSYLFRLQGWIACLREKALRPLIGTRTWVIRSTDRIARRNHSIIVKAWQKPCFLSFTLIYYFPLHDKLDTSDMLFSFLLSSTLEKVHLLIFSSLPSDMNHVLDLIQYLQSGYNRKIS